MNALNRRWTFDEEVTLVKRRRENACAKMIARELGRTPESVGQHIHRMRKRTAATQARLEELALLERLLVEASQPERYPER